MPSPESHRTRRAIQARSSGARLACSPQDRTSLRIATGMVKPRRHHRPARLLRPMIGSTVRLPGALRQPTSPSTSAAAQPMPKAVTVRSGGRVRLCSVSCTSPRPGLWPHVAIAVQRGSRALARARPSQPPHRCFVVALQASPNPSFNASPNGWPGLPCLGHFAYPPSQFMPGQPLGPRYLKR